MPDAQPAINTPAMCGVSSAHRLAPLPAFLCTSFLPAFNTSFSHLSNGPGPCPALTVCVEEFAAPLKLNWFVIHVFWLMANTFGFPPTIQLTWPMAPTFSLTHFTFPISRGCKNSENLMQARACRVQERISGGSGKKSFKEAAFFEGKTVYEA